jgi:hypothetical protein
VCDGTNVVVGLQLLENEGGDNVCDNEIERDGVDDSDRE